MNNNYNMPVEILSAQLSAGVKKTQLPFLKCVLLGIMAGAFIAFGGATSSAAVHTIESQGLAKALAGVIFPVGLMMIVFVGGELFTGGCMMYTSVMDRKITILTMLKTLAVIWVSNLIGALIIVFLIYFSGLFDYSAGALGACTIKTAYAKATITPFKALCSGILCNILVCIAVLMAGSSRDIAGKVWAIFFPIWAFVLGGWEHCVANMYYIPAGIMASMNETYVAKAEELYGLTVAEIHAHVNLLGFLQNQIPVTIGNMIGGMLFVAAPVYLIHRSNLEK